MALPFHAAVGLHQREPLFDLAVVVRRIAAPQPIQVERLRVRRQVASQRFVKRSPNFSLRIPKIRHAVLRATGVNFEICTGRRNRDRPQLCGRRAGNIGHKSRSDGITLAVGTDVALERLRVTPTDLGYGVIYEICVITLNVPRVTLRALTQ
jgi:hypothetical protein